MQYKSILHDRVVEEFKNDNSSLTNALKIINSLNTNYEPIIKSPKKILLLSQIVQRGKKQEKIVINKDDYYYNIESSKPLNLKYANNTINLLTVNEGTYGCGLILLDNELKEARIQSVSNYEECIKCSNSDVVYKADNIMMQIMIDICKTQKIRKISLQDNSKKIFTGNSIELIYFRTITKGKPYYSKYGFSSPSYSRIVRANYDKFTTDPKTEKKIIYSIVKKYIDLNENTKLDIIIRNSLNDIKTNTLSIMFYMNKLYSLAEQEEKKIQIKREEYIKKKKTFNIINLHAWLITILLYDLYNEGGYVKILNDTFVLFLR